MQLDRDHYHRLKSLFAQLIEVGATERPSAIQRECGGDEVMRAELERLLAAHEDEKWLGDASGAAPCGQSHPSEIAGYAIMGVLGVGGMGVVYRARQRQPARDVALKVMRSGFVTPSMRRRFEYEAEVLGRLHHAGIAQVYASGLTGEAADAQPYLVMELIEGAPLTSYAAEHGLDVRARLRLFLDVCEAVEHAHQRGVIHRDLKPVNILVTEGGEVKVLDFGIARIMGENVQLTLATSAGELLGTVAYMSPEQLSGDPKAIDTRSDVYALGVILYELLSGALPHDIEGRSVSDAVRVIQSHAPTRLGSVDRALRGDLEAIVSKAIERDAARRYQSASELAADIVRHLSQQPILARRTSAMYLCRKFAARNKATVSLGAGFVLAVSTLAVVMTILFFRARAAEQRAARNEDVSNRVSSVLQSVFDVGYPGRSGQATTARELLRQQAAIIERDERLSDVPGRRADLLEAVAVSMLSFGALGESRRLHEQALALRQTIMPDDAPDIAVSRSNLADVCLAECRFAEAERYAHDALLVLQRAYDPHSFFPISTMISEALAVQERDPRAAEAMFREIIAIQQTWDPPDPHRVAKSLARLGTLLGREGRTKEAAAASSHAVELLVQNCPDDLFWQVPALWALGEALIAEGRLDEAESALIRVEQITEQHVGSDHAWRVRAMRSLGRLHAARSDVESAELRCQQSLDMARRLFPDSHLETAESLDALGMLYAHSMGRIDEAIPLLEESLAMRESMLADEYFEKARGMLSLGRVLAKAGRFAEAEQHLSRCYALCDAHDAWPSYIGRNAAAELAAVCRARGDMDAAAKWLDPASTLPQDQAGE